MHIFGEFSPILFCSNILIAFQQTYLVLSCFKYVLRVPPPCNSLIITYNRNLPPQCRLNWPIPFLLLHLGTPINPFIVIYPSIPVCLAKDNFRNNWVSQGSLLCHSWSILHASLSVPISQHSTLQGNRSQGEDILSYQRFRKFC